MRRRIVIILAILVLLLGLRTCAGCGNKEEQMDSPKTRTITPEQILNLVDNDTQPLRLRTVSDILPGGLSAAMAPMIIDWDQSEIHRPDGFVIVHNLNYGGNPVEGTTVLQSAKVPLDGVERVEWILVPLGSGGKRAVMHHGQLRFVFRQDRPVQLLDLTAETGGGDNKLFDLVVSWEAWRSPGQDFNVMTGMDAASYALALRLYAGSQRFLEDSLSGRDWFVTPLRLPGGAEGMAELLKVTLAMGDGVARHTLSESFAAVAGNWLAEAPVQDQEKLASQWRELERLTKPSTNVKDKRVAVPAEERTYQTVLRSCATIAYYNVTVAVDRLIERGIDDGVNKNKLDEVHLGGDEPWMKEVATTNLGGVLMRAPAALRWLRDNPQAIPSRIPGRLHEAGLTEQEKGKPVNIHYSLNGDTPYGAMAENLIR